MDFRSSLYSRGIDDVPSEIWAEIFKCEHYESPNFPWQGGRIQYPFHRGSRYPPMHVCRHLRNAALSCAELWNTIFLSSKDITLLRYSDEESLQQWLTRSAN